MKNEVANSTIDNVTTMSENIDMYGANTVIIAVFIVLFIIIVAGIMLLYQKQLNSILDTFKKQSDSISEQNTKILDNLMNEKESEKKEDKSFSNKELVKNYIDIQIVFKNIAKKTLVELQADRVAIYVFHNGNSSAHGFPFFKMSCIAEWVVRGLGIVQKSKFHTDLPLYVFHSMVEKIYNKGIFENISDGYFNDKQVDELTANTVTQFLDSGVLKYLYALGIYDYDKNLAGFIVAEYKEIPIMPLRDINEIVSKMNNEIIDIIVDSGMQKTLEKK